MPNEARFHLSTGNVDVLLSILDRGEGSMAYRALLRRRLEDALIHFPEEIPANVVTLNSRLLYRVDDQDPVAAIMVQSPPEDLADFALSIHTLRGLALLGVAEGTSVTIKRPDGTHETLLVERLLHQPEAGLRSPGERAALKSRARASQAETSGGMGGDVLPFRPKARPPRFDDPDGDNSGPGAA
ncbi:MAG: nucleoside-diphosphate kinase [Rhizobium sp.]|nr:nucleoside-diphosphate kinase [Rhizobium sp.]